MHEGIRHGDLDDDYSAEENYRSYVNNALKSRLTELNQFITKEALSLARARQRDGFCDRPIDAVEDIRRSLIMETMDEIWTKLEDARNVYEDD